MEHLDPLVVNVYELHVVQLLQYEVTGIVKNVAAIVSSRRLQKTFESDAVM